VVIIVFVMKFSLKQQLLNAAWSLKWATCSCEPVSAALLIYHCRRHPTGYLPTKPTSGILLLPALLTVARLPSA
jgi:hypothetical protein